MDNTANTADIYVRRTAIQRQIREEMRAGSLGDEALQLVSTLTEIVLDQVAQACGTPDDSAVARNHAECGALYGYTMGLRMGLGMAASVIPVHQVSGD